MNSSRPQFVRRRTGRTRPLRLRCTCGAILTDINASGENTVIARRKCNACGTEWNVELALVKLEKDLPLYTVEKITRKAPHRDDTR